MKAELYPICQHCGQVPRLGLYDGFRVHGRFFCTECEKRLLEADGGSLFYMDMVRGIKEALFLGSDRVPGKIKNKMYHF
ncbi:MAG: sigma factor G inhibitor Gin [Desulfitobacteriaceae bacterium]